MIKISSSHLWVHDQEVALKYWTEKVGMEVRQDVSFPELGDFRWVTVGPRGQDDVSIVLMAVPGEPVMDEATRKQVLDLTAKGFAGTVFLEPLEGQYPAGVIDWGAGQWYLSPPFGQLQSKSVSVGDERTSATFTFLTPRTLLQLVHQCAELLDGLSVEVLLVMLEVQSD